MSFIQCKLVRKTDWAVTTRVVWIPAKFGIVGKVLKVKERGEEWDDGWTVDEVFAIRDTAPEYRHLMVSCPELKN